MLLLLVASLLRVLFGNFRGFRKPDDAEAMVSCRAATLRDSMTATAPDYVSTTGLTKASKQTWTRSGPSSRPIIVFHRIDDHSQGDLQCMHAWTLEDGPDIDTLH